MGFDYERAYRGMFLIRRTEEEIVARYDRDQMMKCPTHLSIGQESAAVGVMMALGSADHAFSNHRCHAHYLAKGGDLDAMIAELYGKETGCTGGWGGSMHLSDEAAGFLGASPGVGDTISIAVGSAMAFKMSGSGNVAVACFGDAAVETGQFWEAVNFAALHHLPLMLVCENNLYATSTHISQRQPAGSIHQRVKGFMWSSRVEDDEVEDVYRAALLCKDNLPGFLEIGTYRYREHVGPHYDWDVGYRTEQEVTEHMAHDPLLTLRGKLEDRAATSIEEQTSVRVVSAFETAIAAPWPTGLRE